MTGELIVMRLRGIEYPILVRPCKTDASAVIQTYARKEFDQLLPRGNVRFIIDSEAKVIAVEAGKKKFSVLNENSVLMEAGRSPYGPRFGGETAKS